MRERAKRDVYTTLRWLAGASYLDGATSTRLPIATLYVCIDTLIAGLDRALPFRFLHDKDGVLHENSAGFAHGESTLTGCVGAVGRVGNQDTRTQHS